MCVIFSDGPKIHTAVIFEQAQPYERGQGLKGHELLPDELILFCVSDSQNACFLIWNNNASSLDGHSVLG